MSNSSPAGLRAALVICVLALLAVFPPLATDMYLAAIGDVAEAMNADDASAELSLSVFFLGLCLGQICVGPLVDAFGRKLPLLGGALLFTLTSAGLLMVDDIVVFNGLRFLQAIGACTGMAVGRAIVTDLYEGRKVAKVMTVLVTLMTLGPIVSPFLGSLLLTAFGWRSIFVTLVIVGLAALLLTMIIIPETLPPEDRKPGAMRQAIRHYATLATRRSFIVPTVVTALVQAPMFAFITASSGIFQGGFGLTSTAYGILFGVVASSLVVFGQINNLLLNRFGPKQLLNGGLPVFAIFAFLLVTVSGSDQLWLVVGVLWFTLGMVGLLTANGMSVAMAGSPEAAGLGSAGIGAIQFGIAFSTSSVVALVGTSTATPVAVAMLVSAVLAFGLWSGLHCGSYHEESVEREPDLTGAGF